MEKQLSFELLSSGKRQHSPLKKHLSRKKERKQKQNNQQKNPEKQFVIDLLPKKEKGLKLKSDFLSLKEVHSETSFLNKKTSLVFTSDNSFLNKQVSEEENPRKDLLFENLVSVEIVAEMLGLAPKTIHNWVYLRKIPYVKCGQKVMFRRKSLKAWLNRKEIKSWL